MEVETWDEDFDGGFNAFASASVGTAHSISSRLSVHSESIAGGDEDWNLVIDAADEKKTIQSAQQAGIPLPNNVPASALLGGTIKRLGKKKSRQKLNDDWDNDIEMPDSGALTLKPRAINPPPAAFDDDFGDFDELEGSLGIRFAGRDAQNRSSSVSAMSPSLGSVNMESEDELRGLELPEGQMDFEAILMKKRRAAEAELSDLSQPSPALEQAETMNKYKKSKLYPDENDEYVNDFDLGAGPVLDTRKRTVNKNIKIKNEKPAGPVLRPTTNINFHDKPVDKPMHVRSSIPRPVSGSKPASSRLQPVFEDGASHLVRERRQQPTTTGSQLLRSKRSMPVLRSQQPTAASTQRQAPSFTQPAGLNNQPQTGPPHRSAAYHLRRESDPRRVGAQSPPPRAHSRLSNTMPDTPSRGARQRQDVAPRDLAREAVNKRTITKPARKRNYGDGNELEIFDDLPTSTAKENKYVKQPIARGPPKPALRSTQSRGDIRDQAKRHSGIPDRMVTPAPPRTPASPTKGFYDAPTHHNTPSYLRDTAASRIARESRLTQTNIAAPSTGPGPGPRPKNEGPLAPLSTNWKAQVAARSPHTSPSAQRQNKKKAQPQLIKGIGAHVPKNEKGMVYNPQTFRWEGNENTLQHFDLPPPLETPTPTGTKASSYMDYHHHPHQHPQSSPPRPALIAPMSAAGQGVQVNGGMVFDPRQMKWLKLKDGGGTGGRDFSGPLSPSVTDAEEEEDAFAGIEDLKDDFSPAHPNLLVGGGGGAGSIGMASPVSLAAAGAGEIHEEFDLGPRFIETQQAEEVNWRRRCEAWFLGGGREPRVDDERWRWSIRDLGRVGEGFAQI